MGLFQTSVLKKYRKLQDIKAVKNAFKMYANYFHNPERQENIRASKEEIFLDSVIIDKDAKRSIKETLKWLGITQQIIYPGLEGISKSIEDKYKY